MKEAAEVVRRCATAPSRAERARPQRLLPRTTELPADAAAPRPATTNAHPPPTTAPLAAKAVQSRRKEGDHHHLHQQNRSSQLHLPLPSPPRPAGEAEADKSTGRNTFTASLATKTAPERGQEGKDLATHTDVIATVLDAVGQALTPTNLSTRTASCRSSPPTSPCLKGSRRRRGAAEITGGSEEPRVASGNASLHCSEAYPQRAVLQIIIFFTWLCVCLCDRLRMV